MTNTAEIAAELRPVLSRLADAVDAVEDNQLDRPTPCTDLDVRALREHVVGWLSTFADGFADPQGQAPRADLIGYHAPTDVASVLRGAADQLDRAVGDGGADRPLKLGESTMPGQMALSMILWEYQMHGWDLAVATGQPWAPGNLGIALSLDFAPGMLTADYQGPGKAFGPRIAVPADAPPLSRLLALSGRDPGWSRS